MDKSNKRLLIYADGASWGNPGLAAIGVVIKEPENKILRVISQFIGHTTNNVAEYSAVITGLETAASLNAAEVEVFTDSELVVLQINGRYKVRDNKLKPLHSKVMQLVSHFEHFVINYYSCPGNNIAHDKAQQALKKYLQSGR